MPASGLASSKLKIRAQRLQSHHYLVLLFAELAFILGYPFFVGTALRDELFRMLAALIFSAALYAILGRGKVTVIAFVLGTPAILIRLVNVAGYLNAYESLALASGISFLVFVTSVFIWTIVSDPSVTTDTLAGAVSAYLLVGITYGLTYSLTEHLMPGSFRDTVEPGKHISQSEFVFFSFVTLTTVGYGDIVPWSAHARSIAIIEAVTGVMYPAVLISRLIGLHGTKPSDH